ncbi:dUTP diphosphatase [Virgibacillus salexigens]|uniref:dUTPase n=1 Tax=Virgibacillus kapii TaxID=1638645 RepID=A0ABQ2D7D0_9BACI|nr:dUTP diphosphatase [Virgibacillus kapii]GGJ48655.1 hypothetical protein GCM10007111_08470 [Virgibacillus kapii]
MNLNKLFEIQKELDTKIVNEHNLQDQDLLPKKILALQVELGELANEWRGFKFWSKDQEPRNFWTPRLPEADSPLLEEYVDCLHFILSIGLHDQRFTRLKVTQRKMDSVVDQFLYLGNKVSDFACFRTRGNFQQIINYFFGLGELLGFTREQIEHAYLDKNKVNHERQENGY